MKLISGLAVVAYAQSGDGSAETAIEVPVSESAAETPAFRQRALSSSGGNDYEYYYEQSALGRRKKKKKKKIIFNIPQQRPTTTRAPVTTRAPIVVSDYGQLFGENGSFGSKVSDDFVDYNAGSAGVNDSSSNRWTGFGGSDYSYDYSDGFGEITVGNTYGGKGNFEHAAIFDEGGSHNNANHNGADNANGLWALDNTTIWNNDDINKYWEYMHRQWGHQQENRLSRHFNGDASRWYHVGPERVINNLNRGYLNYQWPAADGKGLPDTTNLTHARFPIDRLAYLQAGRHGYPWGEVPEKEWKMAVTAQTGAPAPPTDSGDGSAAGSTAGAGENQFGWYAQPWLWDAGNVAGISDYKLWNGINKAVERGNVGNNSPETATQTATKHTYGFIDWRDADADSWPDDGEEGPITAAQRRQDISAARAPWDGARFDASWELGDSPAHFVSDGMHPDGALTTAGVTPFDPNFNGETGGELGQVSYIDRRELNPVDPLAQINDSVQKGWQRYYSGQRWFPGIQNFEAPDQMTPNMHGQGLNPTGDAYNQRNDPAKLKCHHCIESANLEWDNTYHTFKLVSAFSITNASGAVKHYKATDNLGATTFGVDGSQVGGTVTNVEGDAHDISHNTNVDLWKQCFDTLKQKSCEYSSGVCFVEERRVWGYVTQVQAGCQQAQACYMQKYQNFVVEAGRQCWPGDAFGEQHKLATRPDDIRADQWMYNIIKGGLMLANKPSGITAGGIYDNHMFRKFPSHHFSEMENDATDVYSGRNIAAHAVNTAFTGLDREGNNWIDKFNTDYTGQMTENTRSLDMMQRATLTDGNYGVGRTGYESAYKTLLHYPEFLNIGAHNNYIYEGGAQDVNNAGGTNVPDGLADAPAVARVNADVTTSNQVYGQKIGTSLLTNLDASNKGQQASSPAGDAVPAWSTALATDITNALDFDGKGGADGSLYAERGQFYQNEASRFVSATGREIDDQWRNPDRHNYINDQRDPGTTPAVDPAVSSGIFKQTQYAMFMANNADTALRDNLDATQLTQVDPISFSESSRYDPIEYKNGLVPTSKCHQCCNTDHNCNWNWQPTTKVDWNFAYVWRYQAIDSRSDTAASTSEMGVGANGRSWGNNVKTLSQDVADFTFNFPPYMANHYQVRGNTGAHAAPNAASGITISDPDSTYAWQAAGHNLWVV